MRFWLLEAIFEPWLVNNWYERTSKLMIRANTEEEAREIADRETKGEWSGVIPALQRPWLNDAQTYCEEVFDGGQAKIIMNCG